MTAWPNLRRLTALLTTPVFAFVLAACNQKPDKAPAAAAGPAAVSADVTATPAGPPPGKTEAETRAQGHQDGKKHWGETHTPKACGPEGCPASPDAVEQ